MQDDLLTLDGITKVYENGVVANRNINFSLREGEIHAICGENGAGKSTLMKILFGLEQPNKGRIVLRGRETRISSPRAAIALGIGMVHQHFMLVPSFTVAENLFLGMEPVRRTRFIDTKKAVAETYRMAERYGVQIDPEARVADISVGKMQKVEILKALYRGARILILDEPTAVLTPQEAEELFGELRKLKAAGHTIIFISHKLKEVKEISDRITVIRRGETRGVFETSDVSEEEISRLMVGREVATGFEKDRKAQGGPRLEVRGLSYGKQGGRTLVKDVSFAVRAGEILGIAGVEGNGQRELIDLITGRLKPRAGSVTVGAQAVTGSGIARLRALGVAYIPEDRVSVGSALDADIGENLVATRSRDRAFSRGPFLRGKAIAENARQLIARFGIAASGPRQKVSMLSGGNMQKVVVARECSGSPGILIAEQPTRGVDVGAAETIHRELLALREAGAAILMVSADLNEVLELSDHLLVMYDGEVVARIADPARLSEQELGLYMLGLKRQDGEAAREAPVHE